MSTLEVNKIIPQSGTTTQVGESGDTVDLSNNTAVNLPSGAVSNSELENSSITINGSAVSLGGSVTVQPSLTFPTISGISPSTITNAATNVVITGTNFVSIPRVEEPEVRLKGLCPNKFCVAGSVLAGLELFKPCGSAVCGFGSSCGCFGSNSEICTLEPFHSVTISLYGNSIPDLSDMNLECFPEAVLDTWIVHLRTYIRAARRAVFL
jgi:hypothetical protein